MLVYRKSSFFSKEAQNLQLQYSPGSHQPMEKIKDEITLSQARSISTYSVSHMYSSYMELFGIISHNKTVQKIEKRKENLPKVVTAQLFNSVTVKNLF